MTAVSVEKKVNGMSLTSPEPRFDPVALAEAEAIRTRADADAEAIKAKAQGEARAAETLAKEQAEALRIENEKQQLTLNRNQLRYQREEAEQRTKIAEAEKKREDIERAREKDRRADEEKQQAEEQAAAEIKAADDQWRSYAIKFAIVCGIVSLPVQMSFFWNPHAPWMAAAPIMLEGAAWVVHRGARAAVANRRPVWHYRTIVWLLALIAAGVNLYHGLHSFDPGTALATAFASIAGPGVWDLHEHGRIRRRDGALTRRERNAAESAAKAEAARKAAEEERRAEEKKAAEAASEKARTELTERRMRLFPKVWEHAERLAADLGETDPNAVWARAKLDVEGAKPGESAEVLRMRNAAEARVEAAREKRSVNGSTQQVASQVLGPKKPRVYNPPARAGKRTKGDVKFTPAARRQASIAARHANQMRDAK